MKFERKPSQRYGARQSHILRLRNEQQQQTRVQPNFTLNDTTNILEQSNVLFNNSIVSQTDTTFNAHDETNSSMMAAK